MGELIKISKILRELEEKASRYDTLKEQYNKLRETIEEFFKKVKEISPSLQVAKKEWGKWSKIANEVYEEMRNSGLIVSAKILKEKFNVDNNKAIYVILKKIAEKKGVMELQGRPMRLQYIGSSEKNPNIIIKEKIENEERTVM